MEKTESRFFELQLKRKPVLENGKPKNGQEFIIFTNQFGIKGQIGVILNWKNGYLNNLDNGEPAVQMDDTHTEYWTNGLLDNQNYDKNGNLMPAVIAKYGQVEEFWVNGKKVVAK